MSSHTQSPKNASAIHSWSSFKVSSRCCALGDGGAVAQSMYAVIREMDGALMDRAPRGAEMSGDFTKYNAAKKALAEAVRIDEVKDVHDKATAIWATQYRRQNKT